MNFFHSTEKRGSEKSSRNSKTNRRCAEGPQWRICAVHPRDVEHRRDSSRTSRASRGAAQYAQPDDLVNR